MKKRGTGEKPHLKKKHRVSSRSWVSRIWQGRCTDWFFDKPELVQPPDQTDPRLTHQIGPDLITLSKSHAGCNEKARRCTSPLKASPP